MTRLVADDYKHIPGMLPEFDLRLRRQTGLGLKDLAVHAAGVTEWPAGGTAGKTRVAAVTLTGGEGALDGFAEAVAAVADFLGADAFVTRAADAAGLAEAYESGAEIVMLADDERFVAINLVTRRVSDNSQLTGRAFATALDLMAGGLRRRGALVLGCGPVGRSAAEALAGCGASVTVFDPEISRSRELVLRLRRISGAPVMAAESLRAALSSHQYLLDATPSGGFISGDVIDDRTLVAAPGVPCGVTTEAAALLGERLLYDPLCLGVAAMLMDAAGGEAASP
ncbi:MAG: 3-methylornithyl-N6-L-lysine dehydrogenase PylD [Syntrophobacteraceae bacterium]|nr:3-methylornithyl-N6-L-lysine dehydrogenase PylD [Desulfobacteraceae bacterium]